MINIDREGAYIVDGQWKKAGQTAALPPAEAAEGSIARRVMDAHNTGQGDSLAIRFDALTSHDITFVGIVQTARASGLNEFPLHYILTCCHNSLGAVGGTINEDDHAFGLSAAKKYGGDYVPPHVAVIHQYVREMAAGCGKMILGSDSHTRYGALGCMGVGEGGPELVKQLLRKTYDVSRPDVAAVYLTGAPKPGVGPQDVALALIKAVFAEGLVKNKVLEFIGPGVAALSVEYRMGVDVMTTETTCLSSVWQTDEEVRNFLTVHGRPDDYTELMPKNGTWYDTVVHIDLCGVEPMIALPFHPSNAYPIREFLENAEDLLAAVEAEGAAMLPAGAAMPSLRGKLCRDRRGKTRLQTDQGIIAGCSGGTYENIMRAANILNGYSVGNGGFGLSVYPASQPQFLELVRSGAVTKLTLSGAIMRTAFCGPCFGAGDVPANQGFSLRHTTRNFPSREGSRPIEGQLSYVALMDARSIAATARNKGLLTAAPELDDVAPEGPLSYSFDRSVYDARVYRGWKKPEPTMELSFGPNIADWPEMGPLPENLLLTVAAAIFDPVTTTDELIPSGETSSFRSNPYRLAEFTLSRREPAYVKRAKAIQIVEKARSAAIGGTMPPEVAAEFAAAGMAGEEGSTGLGSLVFALRPGDGSAREQAASCQKVLGGWANIALEYATKRYRSNVVNWGMLPFICPDAEKLDIKAEDKIFIPGIRALLEGEGDTPEARIIRGGGQSHPLTLRLPNLTRDERDIILAGCLINYYARGR